MKISQLENKVIVITSWSLDLSIQNGESEIATFTSYANLEIRMIVHSFKPNLTERLNPTRYPINLFRDDEMKTIIREFRHRLIQNHPGYKEGSIPDTTKPYKGTVNPESIRTLDLAKCIPNQGKAPTIIPMKTIITAELSAEAVANPQPLPEAPPKIVSKKPKGKKQAIKTETPSKVGKLVQKVIKASSASRS